MRNVNPRAFTNNGFHKPAITNDAGEGWLFHWRKLKLLWRESQIKLTGNQNRIHLFNVVPVPSSLRNRYVSITYNGFPDRFSRHRIPFFTFQCENMEDFPGDYRAGNGLDGLAWMEFVHLVGVNRLTSLTWWILSRLSFTIA